MNQSTESLGRARRDQDGSTDLGEILRDGERVGLRFVRRYAHPAELVWAGITESEHLRSWMPCDIVGPREEGADIELPFWQDHVEKYQIAEPSLSGRINVWQPPRVFEWTWAGDVLRFELDASGPGTILTFTTWLESPDPDGAAETGAGYHTCLDQLRLLLDSGATPPLVDADDEVRVLQATYAERLRHP